MKITQVVAVTVCCAALALAACSGSDTPTTAGAPGPSAGPTSAAASSVSAAKVCAYLRGELPTLKAIGSQVGAMANLTVGLTSWYEKQGAAPDGRQLDELTQKECPDTRAEVLKVAGMQSFATL